LRRVLECRKNTGRHLSGALKRLGCSAICRACATPSMMITSGRFQKLFRRSLRQGSDLSRPSHDQLGSFRANGASMRKVISRPRKGVFTLFAMEIVEERGRFLKSPRLGRRRSWPTRGSRSIRAIKRLCRSRGQHACVRSRAEALPIIADDAIDRSSGTGVLKSDAGP